MKRLFQKLSGSFLLLLALAPLLALLFVSVKKQGIHDRMDKALESQELQTLTVPEKDVIWMDRHEIWVNNSMFDIHSKKLERGVYTFTGLYDREETELVNQERHRGEDGLTKARLLQLVFHCLAGFYFSTAPPNVKPYHAIEQFPFYASGLATGIRDILTPPPQSPGA